MLFVGASILVTGGNYGFWPLPNAELITVFRRRGRVSSTYTKLSKEFPISGLERSFCGILDGNMLVGYGKDVYKYEVKEHEWLHIQGHKIFNHERRGAQGCTINNKYLLCGGALRNRVEIVTLEDRSLNRGSASHSSYLSTAKEKIKSYFSSTSDTPNIKLKSLFLHNKFPVKFPFSKLQKVLPNFGQYSGHTITNIGNNRVMVVASFVTDKTCLSLSNRVFHGEFTENEKRVTWKEVECMKNARFGHIAFKMKDNVYVAGGNGADLKLLSSCERYDIKENKWFDSQHSLPYPISGASVSVSADERFSVITGGASQRSGGEQENVSFCSEDGILFFTEKHGFYSLPNTHLQYKREGHVSLRIP